MRRWRSSLSFIGLSGFLLLMIFSRIPSLQAAVLTLTVADPNTLFGQLGVDFNAQFQVDGATPPADAYTFTITSGTLPDPTVLYSNTGELDGIPISEGLYPISIIVSDGLGNASVATPFNVCVGIAISPATLPNIIATQPYGPETITTTCNSGAVTYSMSGTPNVPVGLSINPTTGAISGTTAEEGTFTLRVTALDAAGRSSFKDYTVTSTYPALVATPSALPNGFINVAYSSTITFSGRPGPLQIVELFGAGLTDVPAGTAVQPITPGSGKFTLSGTPTESGAFRVVVRVTDANGRTADMPFDFTIGVAGLSIGPSSLTNATVGVAYSQQLSASGGSGTYTYSLALGTTMPAGLSLTSSGLIDGVPTAASGNYSFTVNVFDTSVPQRSGTRVYNLAIVGGLNPAYGSQPPVGGIISFGLISTPGAEASQALVVTNSGTATLNVTAPSSGPIFTGANAADFRFSGSVFPPFGISPGGTATVVIVCRPSSTLFASIAVMTFRTNDPLRPSVSYELRCNQVIPTATPGVGTPTAVFGTAAPSVQVIGRATGFVTETPDTFATVTFVKGLALRSGPYLGSTMLGIIRPKKDYPVLAMNGGDGEGKFNWYLIVDVDNERIGWASGRYLILKGDPNIPFANTVFDQIDNAKDVKARLTVFGNVNIRARPSDRMPVVHTTAYGTELEIIGRTQQAGVTQWIQVRFYDPTNGRPIVGWMFYNFNAPELMKLTGIAPLDAVPLR